MALQDARAEPSLGDGLGILKYIPEEMRLKVFESLVPDHLPIGVESDVSGDILGHNILRSRKALFSLCFTSKKCYALALPFLYKYVIITDHGQIASLLVTLIFNKERRAWIHRLAVLLKDFQFDGYDAYRLAEGYDFVDRAIRRLKAYNIENHEAIALDAFNEVGELLPQLKDMLAEAPAPSDLQSRGSSWDSDSSEPMGDGDWRELYEEDFGDVNQRLLQLLLEMQTNIKDILVINPSVFSQHLCPVETCGRIMEQFRLDPTQPCPENPLNNLLSIRKQSESNRQPRFDANPLAPEYLGSKDWEFYKDSGEWFFDDFLDDQGWLLPGPPPGDLIVFSHVTDLALYKSYTHPAQLRVILSSCKSLKVFCYTTKVRIWINQFSALPSTDEEEGIPVPTLQQALDEVRETLEELRLGFYCRGYAAYEEEAMAPHKVDVSGFPHLTKVDIDRAFDATLLPE